MKQATEVAGMNERYAAGDRVMILPESPAVKLPEKKKELAGKKGEIKLDLGGEYYSQYVVEVEGQLHQLDKRNLAYINENLKEEYQIKLFYEQNGHLIEKMNYKPSYYKEIPTRRELIRLLEENDAQYATVTKVFTLEARR